jgi:thioredoxin 1
MKANFGSIINSEVPVLTDFFAEWCGPCKAQSPILKELAMEMGNKIKVIKVDVDKNPEIAARYRIQSVPTLVIFKNGQVRYRNSGLLTKPQLTSIIEHNI